MDDGLEGMYDGLEGMYDELVGMYGEVLFSSILYVNTNKPILLFQC